MPELPPIPQPTGRQLLTTWTVLWLAVWIGLFVMMHVPVPRGAHLPPDSDKIIHLCVYFALALLGVRSARTRGIPCTGGWVLKWLAIYWTYAAADELLQIPVNRTASAWDWLADALGAASALAIAYVNRPTGTDQDSL